MVGDYNPYQPQILGQEWVPIRDEDTVFSPAVNTVEVGHGFTLTGDRQVNNARMYVHTPGAGISTGQTFLAALYARGTEELSGPIQRVLIPVNSGGVTGAAAISGSSIASALLSPSDTGWVLITAGTSTTALFFATNAYAAPLDGKRILGVNLYYTAAYAPFEDPTDITIAIEDNTGNQALFGDLDISDTVVTEPYLRARFGEVNAFWSTTLGINTNDRMPWRYTALQRLEASAANRLQVVIRGASTNASTVRLGYAALEVIYCEEQRLAVGGRAANLPFSGPVPLRLGANTITMRSIAEASNPIIPAGDYTVVLSSADVGDSEEFPTSPTNSSQYPFLNAVRELYELPTHPGVQVNIPFPVEEHVGDTFTQTVTHVLPQISLHATGGTLTEPHVYGRQAAAQVYGANTATQEIYDDVLPGDTVFQQVRYVARRFGDTTVPLTLTGTGSLAGSTVAITVDEFDALTEIIDGWKEVTLRFATPPTMGTLATPEPSWTWSATGETAGNRWEILAACAPAVSGIPGNLFNLVPAADQLYSATYQPPAGAQVELTWMPQGVGSPYVTGSTDDDSTDAFLIFSQDPPTVTGVALTSLTQTVTGIGFDCGSLPCCIPSGISYQRITWGLPVNTGIASDDFSRTEAGGWGTASDGHVWTTSGTAANFSVNGAEGLIAPTALNSSRLAWVDVGGTDQDITVAARIADVAESGNLTVGLVGRLTDSANYYAVEFRYSATDTDLLLRRRVAATTVDLVSMSPTLQPASTGWVWIRLQIQGTEIRGKVWGDGTTEPDWMLTYSDATPIVSGTNAGVIGRDNTAAAAPSTLMYDSFHVGPPDYGFGGLELQRFDTVTNTFETIMLASSPQTTGFNDFEARVGVDSVYRIRNLNVYNFAGPWSTQVTGSVPTPGVTGGCDDQTGALIFTSNADQSGGSNAAYVMQWDTTPVEDFGLPEADEVVFQALYGRDGVVAFHGTERGLEEFARILLIHAAAIDPIRLADVKTLRDLAWADLPYICVRDDIGDRWFANVQVPTVNARLNRTKYMARVDIRELTRTPYAVDP